ncbi:hypothetical protein [Pseudomonas nitroreducens]|uniref:hypothetical protein n=1 Tax=Pseudomonas nitroreducens TaxID=46680 RepID=UPI00147AE802|nr:hypothetical protein [Pseudomonas nitroreducens]NNN24670.1 hypothetical protein [Pseudomonas nitroreducens]NNN24682.1 hypothetical protein [Pseudomonas nitroreducens]
MQSIKRYAPQALTFAGLFLAAAAAQAADASVDYTGFTWDPSSLIAGAISLGKTLLMVAGAIYGVKRLVGLLGR